MLMVNDAPVKRNLKELPLASSVMGDGLVQERSITLVSGGQMGKSPHMIRIALILLEILSIAGY